MIPKVGDLVKINHELLDKYPDRTDCLRYFFYKGALKVETIVERNYSISVDFNYDSMCFNFGSIEIIKPNGNFWSLEDNTPPVFLLISEIILAPQNNDGRTECFWCPGIKTQKRGGGTYDICPLCGK